MSLKKRGSIYLVASLIFATSCATRISFKPERSPSNREEKNFLFKKMLREFAESNKTVGAAALFIHPDGDVDTAEFGTIDNEHTPFSRKTKIPIGSLTKSVTSLWFLRTQNKHGITLAGTSGLHGNKISDFFAHSSGLQPNLYQGMYDLNCEHPRLSSDQLRPFVETSSEKRFRYSNLGYELVASLASEKMSENFESSMITELKKIGIENPQWLSCHQKIIPGFNSGKVVKTAYLRDFAAGGLVLSSEDLKIYIESLLKNRTTSGEVLLKSDAWASLFTNHIPSSVDSYGLQYGMGWNLNGIGTIDGNEIFWHTGATPPYQAIIAIIPRLQMGFAFISNTNESNSRIFPYVRKVFEFMSGRPVQTEKYSSPSINVKEWSGNYVGLSDNLFKLTLENESLSTEFMGQKIRIEKDQDVLLPYVMKLWGLIKIGLGDDLYLTAEQNQSAAQKALVFRGLGEPLVFRKLKPVTSFPRSWKAHLGFYDIVPQTADSQALFLIYKVQLYEEDSRLMARLFIKNPSLDSEFETQTPFTITSDWTAVSDDENYLMTLNSGELQLSGFRLRKNAGDH